MAARRFSDAQRAALYLAASGQCSSCGRPLEPGWHGDHVQPWSRGGQTDVINGQALCPSCNLTKGSSVADLRLWQQRALREFLTWTRKTDTGHGFLVEATPGAGKTRFSIEVARQLLQAGRIERIVVVVPTRRLETQWSEAFSPFGICINPFWKAGDGALASDEHGCAVTYGEVGFGAHNYRKLVTDKPTLVILDEVHHCGGEGRSWGAAVREAFAPATVKLLLSGTPFRSDDDEIPFVRYVDGKGVPEVSYGYGEALSERVVRSVFFPRRGGHMEWDDPQGQRRGASFNDELSRRDAQHRLRTALNPTGDWLPGVLAEADQQLAELRQTDPTAAGIVFCEDDIGARAVHRILSTMGRDPVLATSKEDDADARIGAFRKSKALWIVSIRKVSEGVDIPRLRVGVYATTWVTDLFFRQVVGRIIRTTEDEDDPTAWLYIPDDERLRVFAAQIAEQRDAALRQLDDDLLDPVSPHDQDDREMPLSLFTPIAASLTDEGVIAGSTTYTPEEIAFAESVKHLAPDTASLATPLVARLLRNAGINVAPVDVPEPAVAAKPFHERKQDLKQANNTAARRIAGRYAYEHKEVNLLLNRAVGLDTVRQASEEQLAKRLEVARTWMQTGEPPRVEWL